MKSEPYSVGVKILGQSNGQKLIVWYPAVLTAGKEPFSHFGQARRVRAYLEAKPELNRSPYPLIVMSHGLGMGALASVAWAVNMAKQGFVVVAFDHSDALICKLGPKSDFDWGKAGQELLKHKDDFDQAVSAIFAEVTPYLDNPEYRPKEFSAVLDWILADTFFRGLIDPYRIGAVGHSFGGGTVLALGHEQTIDCRHPGSYGPDVCGSSSPQWVSTGTFLKSQCCRPEYQGREISFYDPRIKAILAVGPGTFLFWPLQVNKPVMLISGDHFEVDRQNLTKPFEAFSRVCWLEVKNTDHMTWVDWIFNNVPGAPLVFPGYLGYWFKASIYQKYTLAFFQAHLNGDSTELNRLKNKNCSRISFRSKP